jgi:dipeptidyl aminopeptidase/acylaminoacyl peptidase
MGAVLALAFLAPSAQADPAPRRPVEWFASLPQLSHVTLSPDGRQLAALQNHGDRTVLVTRPVDGDAVTHVLINDNERFRIRWVHWVGNERLLVSVAFAARRGYVGTVETRLLSIKSDGTGLLPLIQNHNSSGGLFGRSITQQIQDDVVDWMPEDGRHVLLALSEPESVLPAVHRVDVTNGARKSVKSPERDTYTWLTDARHRVRVGVRNTGSTQEIRVCDPDGKNWRTAWTWTALEDAVVPLGFGTDPQELYVGAYHEGRRAIFSVRLDDPALPRSLRYSHPTLDVSGHLIRLPGTGEVIGVRADDAEGDGPSARPELWNLAWRAQMRAVDAGLPDRDNRLLQVSLDGQRYIVHSSGNGKPGVYYVGDRGTGELSELGAKYPNLDPATLSGKKAATIQSRDGLPLNAYLTLPQGRRAEDGGPTLPMVLLPHGGPHSRDDTDFDTWTEFLADRGYAVLQVNFRGSDGYGHAFAAAGLKRWGLEMQDDLTDAVQWAVASGIADPARVCIVGASYGGYAALMGVVKTPALYRCAVSFAGVSDLPDLIAHYSDYVLGREAMEVMVGKAWGDRERLRATSPARHADQIRVPVLLAHGTSDRVVPVDQSQTMARALRRANKPHRFIEFDQGDHQLSRYTHRLAFFKALEAFLDEHLQPDGSRVSKP